MSIIDILLTNIAALDQKLNLAKALNWLYDMKFELFSVQGILNDQTV